MRRMTSSAAEPSPDAPASERTVVLRVLDEWLEVPLLLLGLVWLALLIAELLSWMPSTLEPVMTGIWAVFVADYALRLGLAERRWAYIRTHWLTLIALAVPALRILRLARLVPFLRAARAGRTVRAARVLTSLNRARGSVHGLLGRRHGVGYVVGLTVVVVITGAAAMLSFEDGGPAAFEGYAHALWWTAMIVATMGSEQWPVTPEGRGLCLVLAVYGFAVFGYITATIASWFVGRDRTLAGVPPDTLAGAAAPADVT